MVTTFKTIANKQTTDEDIINKGGSMVEQNFLERTTIEEFTVTTLSSLHKFKHIDFPF